MESIARELGSAFEAVEERHRAFLEKYATRYVFSPFMDVGCEQLPGRSVPAGRIVSVQAPERRCYTYEIADKSQILRTEGEHGNIAVYLDEPGPIVSFLREVHAREGFVELPTLHGMPAPQFDGARLNEAIFGAEPLTTARGYRARLEPMLKSSNAQLVGLVRAVLGSITICEQFCVTSIEARHREMDDPRSDAPKRYSTRDLRMLEFAGLVPREQQMAAAAGLQAQTAQALPMLVQRMEERDQQWATALEGMLGALQDQGRALNAVAERLAGAGAAEKVNKGSRS